MLSKKELTRIRLAMCAKCVTMPCSECPLYDEYKAKGSMCYGGVDEETLLKNYELLFGERYVSDEEARERAAQALGVPLASIFETVDGAVEATEETTEEGDAVNHPSHYKHGSFEVIDEMILVFGPEATYTFCIMNSWKYRARAPYKGKTQEDLQKSDRYLEYAKMIRDANSNEEGGWMQRYNLIMEP